MNKHETLAIRESTHWRILISCDVKCEWEKRIKENQKSRDSFANALELSI